MREHTRVDALAAWNATRVRPGSTGTAPGMGALCVAGLSPEGLDTYPVPDLGLLRACLEPDKVGGPGLPEPPSDLPASP